MLADSLTNLSSITRSLSLNAHSLIKNESKRSTQAWCDGLEEKYSEVEMAKLLTAIAENLDAKILNISTTPYEPFGASGTLLMAQQLEHSTDPQLRKQQQSLGHLDASHIAVHSYFDVGEKFAHFRLELEISSCAGDPALHVNKLIKDIQPDFLQMDYRVRGLRWTEKGGVSNNVSKLPAEIENQAGYQLITNRLDVDSQYLSLLRHHLDPTLADMLQRL